MVTSTLPAPAAYEEQVGMGRPVVKTGVRRCFHHRARCAFCHFPPAPKRRDSPRCACCGRFVARARTLFTDRCELCTTRGFVALTLFV